jgi:HAD superfamily hydrolase (TIGR01509 family)
VRAVLWDLDGTLVDSEQYWIAAEYALAELHDASWSLEHALNLVGNDLITSGIYIREVMGLTLSAEEIVEQLTDGVIACLRTTIPWRPGARALLDSLAAAQVPMGLVTMSYRRMVDPILAELPEGTFAVTVTGDQVTRGKPDPEPYLRAAAALGVDPADCVAIEDSGTGAASASAAGCHVLVVPHHVEVPTGERRTFAASLTDVSVSSLAALTAST